MKIYSIKNTKSAKKRALKEPLILRIIIDTLALSNLIPRDCQMFNLISAGSYFFISYQDKNNL